jgi:hypothetical protein
VDSEDDRRAKAQAFSDALRAIKEDREAFKKDPKGRVPALHHDAVSVFSGMSDLEYAAFVNAAARMEEAGFTIDFEGVTLKMV